MAEQFLAHHLGLVLGLSPDDSLSVAQNMSAVNDETVLIGFLQELLGTSAENSQIVQDYLSRRNFSMSKIGEIQSSPGNSRSNSRSRNSSPSRPLSAVDNSKPTHFMYSKGVWGHEETKKQAKKKKKDSVVATSSSSSSKIKVDNLADIDAALQQLELCERGSRKPCNCMAQRHPLLEIAPNCLSCGRIICIKEGLGPCLQCGSLLISNEDLQTITQILSSEKEEITSSLGRKARQKAGIEQGATISSLLASKKEAMSFDAAQQNLDRLLHYQETGAQRTKIIDQVSDFETPYSRTNKWASPLEQAQQLKRQQRHLRQLEQKSLARKGRGKKVVSIEIRGGKAYQVVEDAPPSEDEQVSEPEDAPADGDDTAKTVSYWDSENYGKSFVKATYHPMSTSKNKGKTVVSKTQSITGGSKIKDDDVDRIFAF